MFKIFIPKNNEKALKAAKLLKLSYPEAKITTKTVFPTDVDSQDIATIDIISYTDEDFHNYRSESILMKEEK